MADGTDTAIIGDMRKRNSNLHPVLRALVARHPMERETSLFLFVSLLDFLTTFWMLTHRQPGPRFGESNAIANWFLAGWGFHGLLYFKVALCVFIIVAAQIIHIRRPATARAVLWLGILLTSLTVIYSVDLYLRHAR